MHILCAICSDLVNQADNITVTICGHIFHYNCLSQWIVRSKSCPQCRQKVTDKCMFRLYPNVSNETFSDDAATLQSKLDDAQLQLREQRATFKEQTEQLANIQAELMKNVELLKTTERKLDSRDSAIAALKEQLLFLKAQNNMTEKLKGENEELKKSIQTMNGLQKILNATSGEVEEMLRDYTDIHTVATFATALKRALCNSEHKRKESRDMLHQMKSKYAADAADLANNVEELLKYKDKYLALRKYVAEMKRSRVAEEVAEGGPRRKKSRLATTTTTTTATMSDETMSVGGVTIDRLDDAIIVENDDDSMVVRDKASQNTSQNNAGQHSRSTTIAHMVNNIENASSPYLQLRQSSLALTALQQRPQAEPDSLRKPSESGILNFARSAVMKTPASGPNKTSIFHKKPVATITLSQEKESNLAEMNISYNGLGGHSREEPFPVPNTRPAKSCVPKLTAKHKLKRPALGNKDISQMLRKLPDK